MLADGRRFADDDAGAVVDEKVVADRRAGVDIDTGELVGIFGHHARQHGDAHFVQPVRYPVNADRFKRGIGEHDLVAAHCGGVAVVSHHTVLHDVDGNGSALVGLKLYVGASARHFVGLIFVVLIIDKLGLHGLGRGVLCSERSKREVVDDTLVAAYRVHL